VRCETGGTRGTRTKASRPLERERSPWFEVSIEMQRRQKRWRIYIKKRRVRDPQAQGTVFINRDRDNACLSYLAPSGMIKKDRI
jgi:hypothetical protein